MSKSSVLNLYDAIDGSNHFQVKAFSDKVDFSSSTLPLNLKATLVNLQNADGQTVSDVAGTILTQIVALSQEVSDRQAAVLSETASRISSDAAVQAKVEQEVSDRTAAVSAEASARSSADTVLQSKIDDEVSARSAAVAAEASTRSGADAILQFNLDTESTARRDADTILQANIDQEVSDRTTAVTAEASARSSADITLQSKIDQEVSDRQTAVSTEASARSSADTILQSNINSEASARSTADETLSTKIVAEQTARLSEVAVERSRIDALLQGTSIDLNQLQELINAYTTSDNSILTQIGTISSSITTIQAQLNGTDNKLNALIADVTVTPAVVYTHDLKAILDTALSHAGASYVMSSYTRIFTIGALTHTNVDVLYVEGINNITGAVNHRAVFWNGSNPDNSNWQLAANYNGFELNPSYINAYATVYKFGTDGQPSNIVDHTASL